MRKCLLFISTLLLFTGCDKPDTESTPESRLIGEDTITADIMSPFNAVPDTQNLEATVVPKEEHFLCRRDTGILNFMAGMQRPLQHFMINTDLPCEITGEGGTRVFFRPGCFITRNNKPVSGMVDLNMKECYTLNTMLCENLSTLYGNHSLESKGALYLEATNNGIPVRLKQGEFAYIEMPFDSKEKEGNQVYYTSTRGDDNTNWLALQTGENSLNPTQVPGDFTKPQFQFQGLDLKAYLHEMLNYPEEAKQNELSTKMDISFTVSANGKVGNIEAGETYKTFRDEITRVLFGMPAWQAATYQGSKVPSVIHLSVDFNIRRIEQVKVEFDEDHAGLVRSGSDFHIECGTAVNGEHVRYSTTFEAKNLGWYCCMRDAPQKSNTADVIVPDDAKSEIKLVLKNKMAIAGAEDCIGYARFNSLPIGTEAYVVAVKYDRGRSYYAVKRLKLEQQNIVQLAWIEGDKSDIERAFEDI